MSVRSGLLSRSTDVTGVAGSPLNALMSVIELFERTMLSRLVSPVNAVMSVIEFTERLRRGVGRWAQAATRRTDGQY